MIYKCLNGLMVMPSNIFFPVSHSSWNLRSNDTISLHQPFAHTNTYLYSCVPNSVSLWTNCLKTFTTVSPFLLLNPLLIILLNVSRVHFTLANAICSSCVYYIKLICMKKRHSIALVHTYWQVEAEKILVRFKIEHETTWIQSKE